MFNTNKNENLVDGITVIFAGALQAFMLYALLTV